MALIVCPRCEQDYVVAAKVKRSGQTIKVCPECEATWLEGQPIAVPGFVDLVTHLESLGLTPLWLEELEVIPAEDS